MADNQKPDDKQAGEKPAGKYHYNPGNQSGKTADAQDNNVDKKPGDEKPASRN